MRELAEDARLAQKAIAGLAAGEFREEKLYGHRAVNQGVITADHPARSPCADRFEDLVTSDLQDGGSSVAPGTPAANLHRITWSARHGSGAAHDSRRLPAAAVRPVPAAFSASSTCRRGRYGQFRMPWPGGALLGR